LLLPFGSTIKSALIHTHFPQTKLLFAFCTTQKSQHLPVGPSQSPIFNSVSWQAHHVKESDVLGNKEALDSDRKFGGLFWGKQKQ
jgi:hypothetical protein